jgi:hypothetical protein
MTTNEIGFVDASFFCLLNRFFSEPHGSIYSGQLI